MKKLVLLIILAILGFSLWWANLVPTELVLLPYTPNFEGLTTEDLPNLSDYRGRYEYNGHIILTGLGQIIEYDENSNNYIRVSDPRIVGAKGCVLMSSAKIDNYLFIGCRDYKNYTEDGALLPSSLYKIDLESGKLIKKYFGEIIPSDPDFRFGEGARANLWLTIKNRNLWMSSSDGVEVMDVDSEKFTTYSKSDFSENECWPDGIFNDNGSITLILTNNPSEGCNDDRIVIFNEQTNKWQQVETNREQYIKDHNFKWAEYDPSLTSKLPFFMSVSEKQDGTRYLLADDGVYSLRTKEFPRKIIDSQIDRNGALKSLFSKDGKSLIFIGPFGGGEMAAGIMGGYVVDLDKLEVRKLTSDILFDSNKYELLLYPDSVSEEDRLIYLKEKDTHEPYLVIDLANNTLKLVNHQKVYTDSQYGFSFEYPAELKFSTDFTDDENKLFYSNLFVKEGAYPISIYLTNDKFPRGNNHDCKTSKVIDVVSDQGISYFVKEENQCLLGDLGSNERSGPVYVAIFNIDADHELIIYPPADQEMIEIAKKIADSVIITK